MTHPSLILSMLLPYSELLHKYMPLPCYELSYLHPIGWRISRLLPPYENVLLNVIQAVSQF